MVTQDSIMDLLRTIDDPEMPISIVDLGIVEKIRLDPPIPPSSRGRDGGGLASACGTPGESEAGVPPAAELSLTAGLSLAAELSPAAGARVEIDILPTFVGCPALPFLEREITEKVSRLDGVERVKVRFVFDPPWSVDRITELGRKSLKAIGVTVPERVCGPPEASSNPSQVCGVPEARPQQMVQINVPVACPFCDATQTHVTSRFGPTRCRMIYYCEACRNSFEHMKRV